MTGSTTALTSLPASTYCHVEIANRSTLAKYFLSRTEFVTFSSKKKAIWTSLCTACVVPVKGHFSTVLSTNRRGHRPGPQNRAQPAEYLDHALHILCGSVDKSACKRGLTERARLLETVLKLLSMWPQAAVIWLPSEMSRLCSRVSIKFSPVQLCGLDAAVGKPHFL